MMNAIDPTEPAELIFKDAHGNLITYKIWINSINMDCNASWMRTIQLQGILASNETLKGKDIPQTHQKPGAMHKVRVLDF
jgi:hypothetical protein